MKRIFFITLILLLTSKILQAETHPDSSTTNNNSAPTQDEIGNTELENHYGYELIVPEMISKNDLDKIFGSCLFCEEINQSITKRDATELTKIPFMVKKTILEITKNRKGRYEDIHKIVNRISSGNINSNVSAALRTGERMCQVFYFSFLDNSVQLVGTHRCLVERLNGDLGVFKFTGNRLFVTLKPYKESALAFIGRSYVPEHHQQRYDRENTDNIENDNFGNEVGYVFSVDNKLVLISISQRGFTQPDETFFSCLIIK